MFSNAFAILKLQQVKRKTLPNCCLKSAALLIAPLKINRADLNMASPLDVPVDHLTAEKVSRLPPCSLWTLVSLLTKLFSIRATGRPNFTAHFWPLAHSHLLLVGANTLTSTMQKGREREKEATGPCSFFYSGVAFGVDPCASPDTCIRVHGLN